MRRCRACRAGGLLAYAFDAVRDSGIVGLETLGEFGDTRLMVLAGLGPIPGFRLRQRGRTR